MKQFRIAILASGNGSNAEVIMQHFSAHPSIEVVLLLSNNPNAFALERAKRFAVPTKVFSKAEFNEGTVVLDWLKESAVTHVVLAGFLWLVPTYLTRKFPDRIINIHPALLPRFGGKGMYGMRVHEAVRESGTRESGITIHLVNEHYDEGKILFQCTCSIAEGCTAEDIANSVHELEYAHYSRVIEEWILNN